MKGKAMTSDLDIYRLANELPKGFSHFVTSMTAPVASGWSDGRVGLAPTGKAPPYHGAHPLTDVRDAVTKSLERAMNGLRGLVRMCIFTPVASYDSVTINRLTTRTCSVHAHTE